MPHQPQCWLKNLCFIMRQVLQQNCFKKSAIIITSNYLMGERIRCAIAQFSKKIKKIGKETLLLKKKVKRHFFAKFSLEKNENYATCINLISQPGRKKNQLQCPEVRKSDIQPQANTNLSRGEHDQKPGNSIHLVPFGKWTSFNKNEMKWKSRRQVTPPPTNNDRR